MLFCLLFRFTVVGLLVMLQSELLLDLETCWAFWLCLLIYLCPRIVNLSRQHLRKLAEFLQIMKRKWLQKDTSRARMHRLQVLLDTLRRRTKRKRERIVVLRFKKWFIIPLFSFIRRRDVGPVSVTGAAAISVPELLFRPELFAEGAHSLPEPLDVMIAQVWKIRQKENMLILKNKKGFGFCSFDSWTCKQYRFGWRRCPFAWTLRALRIGAEKEGYQFGQGFSCSQSQCVAWCKALCLSASRIVQKTLHDTYTSRCHVVSIFFYHVKTIKTDFFFTMQRLI